MSKKDVYAAVLAAQESKLHEFTTDFQSESDRERTASGLLDRWIEREEISSVCAVWKIKSETLCMILTA